MGRLGIATKHFASAGAIRCGVAAFILLALVSMHAQEPASLHGTIRDSQGKPIADVTVQLHAKDATATQTVHTDSRGSYSFAAVHDGTYVLRAEMAGYRDAEIPALFFSPKETKTVDLTLLPAQTSASQVASVSKPEFFDQPQFDGRGSYRHHESRRTWVRHGCADPRDDRQRNSFPGQGFAGRGTAAVLGPRTKDLCVTAVKREPQQL